MSKGRKLLALGVLIGSFAAPQAAQAAPASVLGGAVACAPQGSITFCGSSSPRSTAPAFDGVPIDVNVALPDEAQFGAGPYPLIMLFHGYGGGKLGLSDMQTWLDRGYATFSMTDRGFRESCGSAGSKAASGGECNDGYVRLIDTRYEVRDAQEFAGQLADEGLVQPTKVGAIGGSYGGGMSMALGALRNRKMLLDYSLVPWTSPAGKAMEIAAAAPNIPWTDQANSLQPNGATLDYVADAPYLGPNGDRRIGVEKQSFVGGLYVSGLGAPGFYTPEGSDPTADLTGWRNKIEAGEPYGPESRAIVDELTLHHSSYYIDHSIEPSPMLMSSGFTDDLFPADETIRYYNRTKTQYPASHEALFFGDFGHMRGQNKPDVVAALTSAVDRWMDFYVKGTGSAPPEGVTAYTLTCPNTAASGGPFTSTNWATMAPGEIRLDSAAAKTIEPTAGSDTVAAAFNPIGGPGACATADGADQPGTATYRLDPAPAGGYTLMGSATVIADFTLPGDTSQVAARLLDVGPDGQETLVSRGLWRPATGGPTEQVFQLHPNGWQFAEGHVPKLELLPDDSNPGPLGGYGRASNNQQPVTVENLELRLPVLERPGSFGGAVGTPAKRFLPSGYALAADFAALPSPHPELAKSKFTVKGSKLVGKVSCPAAFVACNDIEAVATGNAKGKKAVKVAKGKVSSVAGGASKKLKLKLTGKGKKHFREHSKLKLKVELSSAEVAESTTEKATAVKKGK
jgi:predicted acyl esterase